MTMTIDRNDAAQALGDIEAARDRVKQVRTYGNTSPFLILWGLVWLIADVTTQFAPTFGYTWPICLVVGTLASIAAGFLLPREVTGPGQHSYGLRYFASWGVVMLFVVTLFLVVPVTSWKETHSVFGLVFGAIYIAMGIWVGWRMTVLGVALMALTLFGFYEIGAWYPLYMGVVAGGALVVGGLWLRKI